MRSSLINYGKKVNNINEARAALNYNILKEEIYDADGRPLGNWRGIINSETRRCVGVVGHNFTYIQPSETLEIVQRAVEATGAVWNSVAAFGGGASIIATASLPDKKLVAPKRGDAVSVGFGIRDYFDGSGRISGDVFINVLACTNGAKARRGLFNFSKKHTPSLRDVLDGIRFKFAVAVEQAVEDFRGVMVKLDSTEMTQAEHDAFTLRLFNVESETALRDGAQTPTRTFNRVEEVRSLFTRGAGNVGRTRWDSFNAVTEHLDWFSTFRETEGTTREENRFASLTGGNAARVRETAMELLLN